MATALVVGAGTAGLATALRLARSDWDVVVLDRGTSRQPLPVLGPDRHAARRLAALPHPLHYETRHDPVMALCPDRFGVTVAFPDHDEWFDIVVCAQPCCQAERLPGLSLDAWSRDHVALLYRAVDDTQLPLSSAEALADGLDLYRDDRDAFSWWESTLRPHTTTVRRSFTRAG